MKKYPGFSHSFNTWKMAIIGRGSRVARYSQEAGHYSTQDLEKNPPWNAEDNIRAGLVAIEAWCGGY